MVCDDTTRCSHKSAETQVHLHMGQYRCWEPSRPSWLPIAVPCLVWQLEAYLLSDPLPLDELSSESESEPLLSLPEESESLSSLLLLSSDPACEEQPQMSVLARLPTG